MPRILYVEDDNSLAFVTGDNLKEHGFEVEHYEDGKTALENYKTGKFDICVLDVMLPVMDGFTLAKEIRKEDLDTPILFLTAKSQKVDKIEGLQIGADDYITKPFSMEELVLRIEVFLRRNKVKSIDEREFYKLGNRTFYPKEFVLRSFGGEKKLTKRESALLEFFCKNQNQVLKREEILLKIWGDDDYFLGRSLDVFVSRLRKYLSEDAQFENVHGVGFRMIVNQ